MNMHKYIIILSALLLCGCEKYLSEEPTKQASLRTVDQLEALINNNTTFVNNVHSPALSFSTDDMEFPLAAYTANPSLWSIDNFLHYTFDIEQVSGATADAFWNAEYRKILYVNLVLENVDKVDGDAAKKQQLRADAHLFRAFAYWQLVNIYCLPYHEGNGDALGLPLRKQSDYGESLKRATLRETYRFIENDLLAAWETAPDEVSATARWRASKKGVAAMLSRFYLFTQNYSESLKYSDMALTSAVATLADLNTLQPGVPQTLPPAPPITLNYSEYHNYGPPQLLAFKEFYFTRFYYNSSQCDIPSQKLLDLYDQENDMRFQWFMVPNSNRRFLILSPSFYRYSVFQDGRYLASGPTVAEALLNRAEALARTGQTASAMQTVNLLREKRMKTSLPLAAALPEEAIKLVLEERRRELPFSMRWYDIRRFSVNDDPADDVIVKHTFYTIENRAVNTAIVREYTLAPGELRWAVPINQLEIVNSRNEIEQNKY